MADVSFRSYAMAVMQNQLPAAVAQLETLLGLSPDHAATATRFFQHQVSDPAFMPKAMALRTAVESGTDEQIGEILVACFGLEAAQRETALAAVRMSYPRK